MQGKPTAYQGSDPFVFASYCHDDEALVLPLLEGLMQAGLNVWYDEGIHAGEEWPEVIAEHLLASAGFVAFLSAASQGSHNCRREFNLAMQEEKPFVAVMLEEFATTPALRMQLASVKAIDAADFDSADDLVSAIAQAAREKMGITPEGGRAEGGQAEAPEPNKDESPDALTIKTQPDETPRKRPPKRRTGKIIAAVAAVIVAVGIGLFASGALDNLINGWVDDGSYVLARAQTKIPENERVEVLLTAKWGSSIDAFSTSVREVKNRLDVFAGEGAYDLTVKGDSATLVLPEQAFEGLGKNEALECYIVRATDLYFCSSDNVDMSESIALSRRSIEEATVEDWPAESSVAGGYPEGVEPKAQVVKLVLSPTYLTLHQDEMEQWKAGWVLAQDLGYDHCWRWNVMRDVDGRSVYLYGVKEMRPAVFETAAYNYSQPPLDCTFRFVVNQNPAIAWEDPATDRHPGKNQVAFSNLKGQVTSFDCSSGRTLTAGDVLDWKTALKQRFDAIDAPYAIGSFASEESPDAERIHMVVAVGAQELDACVPSLMLCDTYARFYSLRGRSVSPGDFAGNGIIEIRANEETGFYACIDPEKALSYYREDLTSFFANLNAGETVAFKVDSGATAFRGIYAGEKEGVFVLSDLTTASGCSLDSPEGAWFATLWESCAATSSMLPSSTYEGYWITEQGRLLTDQKGALLPDAHYARIETAVKEVVPDVRMSFDEGCVRVSLGLPVEEGFPARGMDAAKQVLEAVGEDLQEIDSVHVYLTSERDVDKERARVGMYLTHSAETGEAELNYFALVANGRIQPYVGEFKDILANDAYWKSKSVDAKYKY